MDRVSRHGPDDDQVGDGFIAVHDDDPLARGCRAEDDRVGGRFGVSVGIVTLVLGEYLLDFLDRDLTGPEM